MVKGPSVYWKWNLDECGNLNITHVSHMMDQWHFTQSSVTRVPLHGNTPGSHRRRLSRKGPWSLVLMTALCFRMRTGAWPVSWPGKMRKESERVSGWLYKRCRESVPILSSTHVTLPLFIYRDCLTNWLCYTSKLTAAFLLGIWCWVILQTNLCTLSVITASSDFRF